MAKMITNSKTTNRKNTAQRNPSETRRKSIENTRKKLLPRLARFRACLALAKPPQGLHSRQPEKIKYFVIPFENEKRTAAEATALSQ